MTYSQNAEDEIIAGLFGRDVGAVLDIGAFDGRTNSNSLALIERRWDAVLIEPSPSSFLKLLALHAHNPNVKLINAAMGVENTLREFYECADDQCSSFDPAVRDLWAKAGRKYRSYWVAQMTPAMLVQQVEGGYDVISVDCEGASFDILRALPIGSWVPKAIIVEHDARMVEICAWGKAKGFQPRELNAENVILVKR